MATTGSTLRVRFFHRLCSSVAHCLNAGVLIPVINAGVCTQSGGAQPCRSVPASLVQLRTKDLSVDEELSGSLENVWRIMLGSAFSGRSTYSLESLKMASLCTLSRRSPKQNIALLHAGTGCPAISTVTIWIRAIILSSRTRSPR